MGLVYGRFIDRDVCEAIGRFKTTAEIIMAAVHGAGSTFAGHKIMPVRSIMKNLKTNFITTIQSEINTLSPQKLNTFFHIIFYLNCACLFFMTEEDHTNFIKSYYQYPSIRNPEIFKSFLIQSIEESVFETRYLTILKTIDFINQNHTFENITNILLS